MGERARLLWAFLGLFLASTAWAMSTPIGGVPDEPAHIVRAASVARGEVIGTSTEQPAVTRVTVPASIAALAGQPCFAHDPDATADCAPAGPAGGVQTAPEAATTSAGLYNPVYYALVGAAALPLHGGPAAVYAMRIASGALVSALLAVAYALFRRIAPGRAVDLAFAAAATPMVLFLSGAVNPNALEVASGACFLAALLTALCAVARPAPALALAAVAGVLLANARGLGPLWLAVLALTALLASDRRALRALAVRPAVWVAGAVLATGGAFAVVWILGSSTLANMGTFNGAGASPLRGFTMTFLTNPDPGLIGWFGWLDHVAPPAVIALWSALALTVLGAGLILARGRRLAALCVLLAAVLVLPAVVQAASIERSGYIWQGRYTLVAYVSAVLFAGSVVTGNAGLRLGDRASRRLARLIGLAVPAAHGYALLDATKRYAVGADADWPSFLADATWLPPGGPWLWCALAVAGAGLTLWKGGALGGPRPTRRLPRESVSGSVPPRTG